MNDPLINLVLFGAILLPILALEFWFFWRVFGPREKMNTKGETHETSS